MVSRVFDIHQNNQRVVQLVRSRITNARLKSLLLLELGQLEEGFAMTKKTCLFPIYPVVREIACRMGKLAIAADIYRGSAGRARRL
jgi:hypothetical protein